MSPLSLCRRRTEPPTRVIFEQHDGFHTTALTNYDVSADGQRFLMVKGESGVQRLSVVLNWSEELKQIVPTK